MKVSRDRIIFSRHRWYALAVLLAAAFMDLIDTTIVTVAIPRIRHDLAASESAIEWVIAAYQLAFGLALIPGGRLGDLFGRKRLFLLGVAAFTIASLLCGGAPTAAVLIGWRALQGLAAALMVPQVLSLIQVTFTADARPRALAAYGATAGLAAVCGPLLGGILTHANIGSLSWRAVFFVNVPIGVASFLAAMLLLPKSAATRGASRDLDLTGTLLLTLALVVLTAPLTQRHFALCLFSSIPFALFVAHERRKRSPLVPMQLFGNRGFAAGVALTLIFFSGIVGFFLVLVLHLQSRGFDALRTGLSLVPFSLAVGIGSGVSVPLARRFSRNVTATGCLVMAFGIAALIVAVARPHLGARDLIAPLAVAGAGMGLVVAPLFDIAIAEVPHGDAGSASGVLNAANQIGGAIGVAVVGTIFFGAGLLPTLLYPLAVFITCAALSTLLPRRIVEGM